MNHLGSLLNNEHKNTSQAMDGEQKQINYVQAVEWFKKAANRGCARAMNNLAICYEQGHGVESPDMDLAFQLYSEAAAKEYLPAIYNLAFAYLIKGRQTKLPDHYKEAAKLFHKILSKDPTRVKAYTKCGDLLYSGKGCGKKDKGEAFKCYQRAASMNDSEALNNLGLMIEVGFEDRPGDPDQALEYYRKANKLGNTDASINIAIYYINGVHVERDPKMGKQLLKQAYKNGNEKAVDYMVTFGFIKNRKEMEAEMLNIIDEEMVSQMGQSSTGFNNPLV